MFEVHGRGTMIVPVWLSDHKIRSGDTIQLRDSKGQVRDTRIVAVEIASGTAGSRSVFLLPRDIAKDDIAEGTEIWSSEV